MILPAVRPFAELAGENALAWVAVAHVALGWKFFRSLRECAREHPEEFPLAYCLRAWALWPWYVSALIYQERRGRWPAWAPADMRTED